MTETHYRYLTYELAKALSNERVEWHKMSRNERFMWNQVQTCMRTCGFRIAAAHLAHVVQDVMQAKRLPQLVNEWNAFIDNGCKVV